MKTYTVKEANSRTTLHDFETAKTLFLKILNAGGKAVLIKKSW